MNDWAGHVLLIVNTASKCGLTGQYEGLQRIFNDYAMRGFFVIGVPCNQFGEQEPGTADEISDFCSVNYGVSFPLLAKADVNGENTHPLYAFLKDATGGEDIQWNFEKFVVSDSGEVLGRFSPKTTQKMMSFWNSSKITCLFKLLRIEPRIKGVVREARRR